MKWLPDPPDTEAPVSLSQWAMVVVVAAMLATVLLAA